MVELEEVRAYYSGCERVGASEDSGIVTANGQVLLIIACTGKLQWQGLAIESLEGLLDNTQQEMAQLAAARDAESSCADLLARGFNEMVGHASAERQQRMEAQAVLGTLMHTVVLS